MHLTFLPSNTAINASMDLYLGVVSIERSINCALVHFMTRAVREKCLNRAGLELEKKREKKFFFQLRT